MSKKWSEFEERTDILNADVIPFLRTVAALGEQNSIITFEDLLDYVQAKNGNLDDLAALSAVNILETIQNLTPVNDSVYQIKSSLPALRTMAQLGADLAPSSSWTPVITSEGGSITSYTINSATYKTILSSLIYYEIDLTVPNIGTASGYIQFTKPVSENGFSFSLGRTDVVGGNAIYGYSGSATVQRCIRIVSGGFDWGNNVRFRMSGWYKI